ncbi:hypothetical protein GGR57DRAFT_403338 [Xylariaceae sp. FL1272]|nr:hypothetical protein GGR57DRAFT_403338 [Xylariaceae sp. FL1272]
MASIATATASETFSTVEPPKTKPAHKIRKRAPKACLSCRARKVRCDVSQRGRPCMNCYLDSETCVVTGRASRFRKAQREGTEDVEASHPPYAADDCAHGRTAEDIVRSRINGEPASSRADGFNNPQLSDNPASTHSHTHSHDFATHPEHGTRPEQQSSQSGFNMRPETSFNRPPSPSNAPSSQPMHSLEPLISSDIPLWVGDQRVPINADITYSYYPFLTINNLHNIMPQDVNYLESQGCLRVPTRDILDEFVKQYFLHVHPLLPLINEGDFWDLYCHQGNGGTTEKLSLLVFQAMLFSCCNFVSKTTINSLGFPNIRAARATFYRRTKLLYDLDTEASLVYLAQTALLLSYWSPNWSHATKKPNTAWLGIAIQNAKSAEAHLYSAMPTFSAVLEPIEHKKQNILKRLWWCCVIRDRILPLGMRRSIQISRAHFDLDTNSALGYVDLADEVERSRVYNAETKRSLIEIFVQIGELCSVLTDILTLVFPMDDIPGWGRHTGAEGAAKVRDCKMSLRRWYKGATLHFPLFGGAAAPRKSTKETGKQQHESVIIYTNLMYMYYHSARAALSHHEVLQSAVAFATPNANSNIRQFSNIYVNRHELQDAAYGVTECLKELIQLGLARYLPISAVACTALPLVLHILDVKLSIHNKDNGATADNKSQIALKQSRLNILIEAMKTYQPQYDGVDYISETIRHIINLSQLDHPSTTAKTSTTNQGTTDSSAQPTISDWADMLASQPGYYLRLAMTMDISISKGRLAEESDFPVGLRGLFSTGLSPVQSLMARGRTTTTQSAPIFANTPQTPPFSMPNHVAGIQPGSVHSMSSDEDTASPESVEGADSVKLQAPLFSPLSIPDLPIQHPSPGLFSESGTMGLEMDNIAADVLTAYMLRTDTGNMNYESPDSGLSDDHSMYDGDGDKEEDWIERAWSDEGRGGENAEQSGVDIADRETARVLLDALRGDSVSACA